MLSTRIVTDSTCDLPAETAEKLGIRVIPNYINIGEESYLDGVDISHNEFYKKLSDFPVHPKTSAPGSGMFEKVYRELADEGANQIISIHIHSGLSNLSNAARIATETIRSIKITVVEVGQVALGLGFMAMTAAEAALDGKPIGEIIDLINDQDRRTEIFAALDTLHYLSESGRAPSLLTGVANLLRIKPIIRLHQGVLKTAGRTRTTGKSIDWLVEKLHKIGRLERLAVLHTNAFDRAEDLRTNIQSLIQIEDEILISEATPILGVHVGPDAIGLVCVKAF